MEPWWALAWQALANKRWAGGLVANHKAIRNFIRVGDLSAACIVSRTNPGSTYPTIHIQTSTKPSPIHLHQSSTKVPKPKHHHHLNQNPPPHQTWNLSKILHRRIFRLEILHRQFHLISTDLVKQPAKMRRGNTGQARPVAVLA